MAGSPRRRAEVSPGIGEACGRVEELVEYADAQTSVDLGYDTVSSQIYLCDRRHDGHSAVRG